MDNCLSDDGGYSLPEPFGQIIVIQIKGSSSQIALSASPPTGKLSQRVRYFVCVCVCVIIEILK